MLSKEIKKEIGLRVMGALSLGWGSTKTAKVMSDM